jgi:hypothetical protein
MAPTAVVRRPWRGLAFGLGAVLVAFVATWAATGGEPEEPATFLTDYLLAGLGVGFAVLLWTASDGGDARRLWAGALATIGAGAAIGGSSHALGAAEDAGWLWNGTMIAIGLASCLLGVAAVRAFVGPPPIRSGLTAILSLALLAYVWWVLGHPDFQWAVLDYGLTLAALLVAASVLWWRRRETSAPWLIGAILVSFVAAGVQQLELSPHPRFNHNDLYHLVQAAGLWLFYRAGRSLPAAAEGRA